MATAMGACLTPLDRVATYLGGQLVIDGQISSLEEMSVVFVGRTASRERLPQPVTDAAVKLLDDLGNEYDYHLDAESEKYRLVGFSGVPGRTYHIRVVLPEGGTFESVPEKMPLVTGTDEIYYTMEPEAYTDQDGIIAERYFLKIYSNHTLPSSPDPIFLKWHTEEVYLLSPTDFPDPFNSIPPPCYISQRIDPQKIVLFDNETTKTTHIPNLHIASRRLDRSFKERHYLTTYQWSMTREAHAYWRKVDIVANQTGSIFDAPPARVRGNLFNAEDPSEEVYGYFQAVNQSLHRFYLLPHHLPFSMPAHCEYMPERNYYDYPSECIDCTSVANSSYNRPPWF